MSIQTTIYDIRELCFCTEKFMQTTVRCNEIMVKYNLKGNWGDSVTSVCLDKLEELLEAQNGN